MSRRRHEWESDRHHQNDPVAKAILVLADATRDVAESIHGLAPAPSGAGHFSLHVTEVQVMEDTPMPAPIDTTPDLDLASSSVRAKLSVVNPRLANGQRVTSVTWSTDDETELPLEAAPDGTEHDAEGNEILDPVDNLPLLVFSVHANTPLVPEPGTKADGIVTVSAAGMVSRTKRVTYGDAPLGHFTMEGVEAAEV